MTFKYYIYTILIFILEPEKQSNVVENEIPIQSTSLDTKDTSSPIGLNPNVVIKEEIIESDEFSDSELVKEVEAIEMSYMVKEEQESDAEDKHETEVKKKDDNLEFGTEDMFENESSSESIIIDEMDLIKDNSGLSQNQILAIIKQQNFISNSKTEDEPGLDSGPSTSKGYLQNAPEKQNSGDICSVDSTFISNHGKLTEEESLKSVASSDSKILDSLYFKMTKNIQSVLSKQKATNLANKIFNVKRSLGNDNNLKNKPIEQLKTLDLSTLDSKSSESENEINSNLPCTVSELVLPNSNVDRSFLKDTCHKVPERNFANETNPGSILSSSESDDEFLEVPTTNDVEMSETENRLIGSNKNGLHIEIQPVDTTIENDIFADIFLKEVKTSESDKRFTGTSSTKDPLTLNDKNSERTGNSTNQNLNLNKHKPKKSSEVEECSLKSHDKENLEKTESSDLNSSKIIQSNVSKPIEKEEESFSKNYQNENTMPSNLSDHVEKSTLLTCDEEDEKSMLSTNIDQDSDDSISVDDPPPIPEGTTKSVSAEEKPKRKLDTKQLEKLQVS